MATDTGPVGLDTNVLLRWVVRDLDDPAQDEIAARHLEGRRVFVNVVVLVETLWLAKSTLGMGRADQAAIVRRLLSHPHVEIGARPIVADALAAYELGGAGFADHLIGMMNVAEGCATTLTFDKAAARGERFTLIS